jgi:hypothetical protein
LLGSSKAWRRWSISPTHMFSAHTSPSSSGAGAGGGATVDTFGFGFRKNDAIRARMFLNHAMATDLTEIDC